MLRLFAYLCLFTLAIFASPIVQAKINIDSFGFSVDSSKARAKSQIAFDSTLQSAWQMKPVKVSNYIAKPRLSENNTLDFYLLLGLCAILGAIKTLHPKYFNDVWRAFINPTLGSRQLKDIIQSATFPNLLMNLYSSIVLGTYAYYLISVNVDWRFAGVPSGVIVSLLALGAIGVYTGKYAFVHFTGWAFNIRSTTEQYNFNIFLVNKILGMALLPFIICFAFLNSSWDTPLCIISLIILIILVANRYVRSWIFLRNSL